MSNKNESISQNNKRIARNTLMLYLRMVVVTLLSFVTVRYTLQILGVKDYGIYNVVGGVVTFLTFITATISSATQRFLAFELGRKDKRRYNDTFNMLLLLFAIVGFVVFAVLECISYPVIHHWLVIPPERFWAAEVVYHTSAIAFVLHIVAIPFLSSILANEKMGVYAYITIADTILKLLLLGLLIASPFDKLNTYSVGMMLVALVINGIYVIYNQRFIGDTRIYYFWDKRMCVRLLEYTGWSFFGALSGVLCNQGLTVLMNLFFGVGVNAAKGISDRVNAIIQSFVANFYLAVSPQITKTYAAGDKDYTVRLVYTSTRLAFYLMLILTTPVLILTKELLHLWLGDTCTEDMALFTQLTLIFSLVQVFETPVTYMMRATGNIKLYQVSVGCITLLILPVTYVLYKQGLPAYIAFLCQIAAYAIVQVVRILVAKQYYSITLGGYYRKVVAVPVAIFTAMTILYAVFVRYSVNPWIVATIVEMSLVAVIWTVGIKKEERTLVIEYIRKKCHR